MKALIVSPSALLRSTLREILDGTAGVAAVRELGSGLQLDATLGQFAPSLVLWDESLGPEAPGLRRALAAGGCHLVVLQGGTASWPAPEKSRPGQTSRLPKPDFAHASSRELTARYQPVFARLAVDLAELDANSPTDAGTCPVSLVVIGASTGGPTAVRTVLSALPADFPVGIALVQHIDTGYDAGYAQWLTDNTRLKVRLAVDNDRVRPGEVIVGPVDYHLLCAGDSFSLDQGPKVLSQRPAVDRLFSSAAQHHRAGLLGVLLTGIGSDGGQGCLDIVRAGGQTIAQDEASSTVYGMPKAAADLGAASLILPLDAIGAAVDDIVRRRRRP